MYMLKSTHKQIGLKSSGSTDLRSLTPIELASVTGGTSVIPDTPKEIMLDTMDEIIEATEHRYPNLVQGLRDQRSFFASDGLSRNVGSNAMTVQGAF